MRARLASGGRQGPWLGLAIPPPAAVIADVLFDHDAAVEVYADFGSERPLALLASRMCRFVFLHRATVQRFGEMSA
jgi:hypothetical protein